MTAGGDGTRGADYAARLAGLQGARWKRVLDVQRPYRRKLRRLDLGRTLDVGCGIGRNLDHLAGAGVGVDHNEESVVTCRARGFEAYTTEEFPTSAAARTPFSALLFSHVLEHMRRTEAIELVTTYLPYLARPGRVVLITPQERGHASDPTHVELLDGTALRDIADRCGLEVVSSESFPLPRPFGRWFTYNEFVVVATAP